MEHHVPGQFLSNIFLLKKKVEGNFPCINLEALNGNRLIPYKHFKMEGVHCLQYLLEENDFFCITDLKDAYFSMLLCMSLRKLVRFTWLGNLYEFFWLCFGLGAPPRKFSKLLKGPIGLMSLLSIRLMIYLDDILQMERMLEEILMIKETLIFLLQHLCFVINLKS